MKDLQIRKLKELLKKLDSIRGKHTELVTVYVPAGYSLSQTAAQLRNEQSTAMNIKSKTVRKNVTGALERILQHIRLYKDTPPNGLAIFAGNVSERDGVSDIQVFALEPPEKISTKLYYCSQNFVLDPLRDLIREREIYGLLVLDKSEASIGLIRGKRVEELKHLESIVPGKTKKGGQSAARFARVREGLLFDFLKQVGEVANHHFRNIEGLKGIIIGGSGPIKERMAKEGFLMTDLKDKILGVVDTSYSGTEGLDEVLERSEDLLSEASIMKEKLILDKFFNELAKDSSLAIYGIHEVLEALNSSMLELLLISEEFDWVRAKQTCKCGYSKEKITRQGKEEKCPQCESIMDIQEEDLVEEMEKIAEQSGTQIEMISTGIPRGVQLREIGGVAGILRFRV